MDTINILNEILKFKSITPKDDGALNFISMMMNDFEARFINGGDTKNLFLSKKFGDGVHLCFAGHVDVVPPGDGWESEPFVPMQKDGFIYARGTQDMKSGVAAFLSAISEISNFKGTISVLLTSDEEGDGTYGTKFALEELKNLGLMPDFAVVAEPTCQNAFGDTIKIGRRGSINGTLLIHGKQGHVAYPSKCINPAHQLAKVFGEFAGHDMDGGSDEFEPSKIVITDIRGGMEVCNVTPSDIKIMFNVRNSTDTSLEDVKNYCDKIFAGLDYELNLKQSSMPFLTARDSKIAKNLAKSVEDITGIKPSFNTAGGTSDARHLAKYGVEVVEFGVINDRIHAKNERVSLDEVENLKNIFKDLIENFEI